MTFTATAAVAALLLAVPAAVSGSSEEPAPQRQHPVIFGEAHGRRGRATKSPAHAARRLQGLGGMWPQEHLDALNSGSTDYIGPGDVDGFCRNFFLKDSAVDPSAERFYATGVTSMSAFNVWFGGGTSNTFRIIQQTALSSWEEFDVDLNALRPGGAPAWTGYGITSSGAAWPDNDQLADSYAVASADGTLYTLWWPACTASVSAEAAWAEKAAAGELPPLKMPFLQAEAAAYKRVPHTAVPGAAYDPAAAAEVYAVDPALAAAYRHGDAEAATAAQAAAAAAGADGEEGGSGLAFPTCLQWTARFGYPSYSATRYVAALNGGLGPVPALVLASETNAMYDTAGAMHAFYASNGSEIWQYKAIDGAGNAWGLKGVIPAIDVPRGGLLYLAFGSRIVALNPLTGVPAATLDVNPASDPAPATDYAFFLGYLADGDDVQWGNYTWDQAVANCSALPACVGFTHAAPDAYPVYPTLMYLKSTWKFTPSNSGWSSFAKPGFGADPFVSSPTLEPDGNALFLHSATGSLWKIALAGGTGGIPLTMSVVFVCDFVVNPPAGQQPCVRVSEALRQTVPLPTYDPTGTRITGWQQLRRADFHTPGAFYQPTTQAQKRELMAAVRDEYLLQVAARAVSGEESEQGKQQQQQQPPVVIDASRLPTQEELHAMSEYIGSDALTRLQTPSGYVRLGPNGKPLHVLPSEFPGVYPYATAAVDNGIFISSTALVVPQWLPYERGDEGVFCVDLDGNVIWSWSSWRTTEGQTVNFGRSRSSPAIDGLDYVYVAADTDDPLFTNSSGVTLPALFALDMIDGSLVWATTMGFEASVTVGSASPMVVDGYQDGNNAYMVAEDGLVLLGEGSPCPTDDPIFECSGHGKCNCVTGQCVCYLPPNKCFAGPGCSPTCGKHATCNPADGSCTCSKCWRGANCDTQLNCGPNSYCNEFRDSCECQPCWSSAGGNGSYCTVLEACNGHGSCSASTGRAVCMCANGWSGPKCATPPPDAGGASAGSVAAGVLLGVPAVALSVLGAYAAVWKYRNPLQPVSSLLPDGLKKRLGFSHAYASVSPLKGVGGGGSGSGSSGGGGDVSSRTSTLGKLLSGGGSSPGGGLSGANTADLSRTRLLATNTAKTKSGGIAKMAGSYGSNS